MTELEELREQAKILSNVLGNKWAKIQLEVRSFSDGTTKVDYWIVGDGFKAIRFDSFYDVKQAVSWFQACFDAEEDENRFRALRKPV